MTDCCDCDRPISSDVFFVAEALGGFPSASVAMGWLLRWLARIGLCMSRFAWTDWCEPIGMNRLADRLDGTVLFFLRAEALPSCRSAEMVVADEECSYRRTKRNDCEET